MIGLAYSSTTWGNTKRILAVLAIGAIAATGCGGNGGDPFSGIRAQDEHGDASDQATLIRADGGNVRGQINFGGDVDAFTFRAVEGVAYVIQVEGFPVPPGVNPDFDLTGEGIFVLATQIIGPALTQVRSTTGTEGGEPYDIAPALGSGAIIDDSRIVFVPPMTGEYVFFIVNGERPLTGIGDYVLRVASSQLSLIGTDEVIFQTGKRFVQLIDPDQDPPVLFQGTIAGGIEMSGLEIRESLDFILSGGPSAGISQRIFLPNQDEPEPVVAHIHYGLPNNFAPQESINLTPGEGDDPHPFVIEFELSALSFTRDTPEATGAGTMPLPNGETLRFPVTVEVLNVPEPGEDGLIEFRMIPHLDEGITSSGTRLHDGAFEPPDLLRTLIGFDWYLDLHPQPDMELDPFPIATSRPWGDVYQIFETALDMDPANVVLGDGTRLETTDDRGVPGGFELFYDSSLKVFQVARQFYEGIFATVFNPPYAPAFVGDRVKVHAGGPGQVGPVIIDVGTLPPPEPPPTAPLLFPTNTQREQPGFRTVIRQLTDAEAITLRNAFYGNGFYVEVTDGITGEPLARAEGNLELSTLDSATVPLPFRENDPALTGSEDGTVNFVTTNLDHGPVRVVFNGREAGVLREAVDGDELPACGLVTSDSVVSAMSWPERYYWHAHAEDGTMWDGHVSIESGGCHTVVLDLE